MKCLKRNRQTVYYANFISKHEIIDDGFRTGDFENIYETPHEIKVNVSAAKGENYLSQFGESQNYDKVIVCENDINIKENAVLWIGITPDNDYNYTVARVANSLNTLSIAIKQVQNENQSES